MNSFDYVRDPIAVEQVATLSFGEFAIAAASLGMKPKARCNCSSTGFDFSGADATV